MTEQLQKKVNMAVKLIQAAGKIAAEHGQALEICYSGGKDSDVILELAKMSGVNYRAIYKNTTIDPPGTIKHAREMGAEVIQPKENFRSLVEKNGMPNRFFRFCCTILKEYKVLDYAVVGIRRDESVRRAERYKEPETCRTYKKGQKVRQYLPILEWTSEDVSEFIAERGIKCHALYYDEAGEFHPERRLGCMCCPMAGIQTRIKQFKTYPGMVRYYTRAAVAYWEKHPDSKRKRNHKDPYEWVTAEIFCDGKRELFLRKFGPTIFDDGIDCKEFLENYFKIEL